MSKPHRSHEEATIESFKRDPAFAGEYLNDILEDGGQAELNATSLYRTLSPQGNPELRNLRAVLDALGLRLAVHPKDAT